ncbi:MAG: 2-oxo acid dehydrogenase subunit E2, partial [Actinobacteria bacterium]|nr:2-oxo acid dehydrogenase subunit E2 [Actinomycetota bacterium]
EPGVVAELLVKPGQKVPVGEAIARLDEEGAPASGGNGAEAPVRRPSSKPPRTEVAKSPSAEPLPADLADSSSRESRPSVEIIPPPPRTPTATGAASPAARRRAAELGVDLSTVKGSGPGGVIKLADLEGSAEDDEEAPAPASAREEAPAPASTSEADPHQALRNAIARAMARSKREIPHYYLQTTVDVTRAQQWLEQENEERGIKERLLFGGLLTRAVALAARDVPVMNGFFEDGRFTPSEAVHVGFAVAMRGGGVVAPAIHDVDSRSLDETMAAGKDIVRRVRRGKLRSSEMSDPTITLTSLGDMGVDTVFGVIYPPQVAIVGAG